MHLKHFRSMKCSQKVKISINQAFLELNLNEQSLLQGLEILNHERLYFTIKMQKPSQNTKNILWKTPIYRKTYFTQCQNNEIIFERNKHETQWWVELFLSEKLLMLEIKNSWVKIRALKSQFKNLWKTSFQILISMIRTLLGIN